MCLRVILTGSRVFGARVLLRRLPRWHHLEGLAAGRVGVSGGRGGPLHGAGARLPGAAREGGRQADHQAPQGARQAREARAVHAQLPVLLAVPVLLRMRFSPFS